MALHPDRSGLCRALSGAGASLRPGFGASRKPSRCDGGMVHRYSNVASNANDRASKVASDAAGDIIVTGSTDDRVHGPDMLTIKYSGAGGAVLWQQRYNGLANRGDYATAMAVEASGKVVVIGSSNHGAPTSKPLPRQSDDSRSGATSAICTGNIPQTSRTQTDKDGGHGFVSKPFLTETKCCFRVLTIPSHARKTSSSDGEGRLRLLLAADEV